MFYAAFRCKPKKKNFGELSTSDKKIGNELIVDNLLELCASKAKPKARREKLPCLICEKSFGTNYELKRHETSKVHLNKMKETREVNPPLLQFIEVKMDNGLLQFKEEWK